MLVNNCSMRLDDCQHGLALPHACVRRNGSAVRFDAIPDDSKQKRRGRAASRVESNVSTCRSSRGIESLTTDLDKRSLLACQLAVRNLRSSYVYLEIGSHLGGSLQTHVLDDRCEHIFSIDKRPTRQPDERGQDDQYPDNSTDRMLDNLKRVSPNALHKISCFDDDAANIDPALISPKPQICFIDGEHTDRACVSDAEFCLKVIDRDGLLVFHDAIRRLQRAHGRSSKR